MANFSILDQGANERKASVIDAMMGNPKINKIINDALESKIGSTKRNIARSVIKSLKVVNYNKMINDGQGGIGFSNSYSSMFAQTPLMKINARGEQLNNNPNNLSINFSENGGLQPSEQKNSESINFLPPAPERKKEGFPTSFTAQINQKTGLLETPMVGQINYQKPQKIGTTTSYIDPTTGQIKTVPSELAPSFVKQYKGKKEISFPQTPAPQVGPTPLGPQLQATPVPPVTEPPTAEEEKTNYYDEWFNGLSPADQVQYQELYDAVKNKKGVAAFTFDVLSNHALLKKMFPGVPDEYLPEGATLAGQIDELDKRLKEEYNLNGLLDNANKLQEQGYTLKDSLQDYTRGRDQYVRKIDAMIDDMHSKAQTMDMANPYVKQQMQNYSNYLYTLKGRQEKRYVDYMNTSINEFNAKQKAAVDQYNNQYNKYTKELAIKSAITEENFNYFKDMLSSMYNNVNNLEKNANDLYKAQLETQKTYYDILKTAVDTQVAANKLTSNPAITSNERTYYDNLITSLTRDDKTNAYHIPDFSTLLKQVKSEGYYPDRLATRYIEDIGKLTNTAAENGEAISMWDKINNILANLIKDGDEKNITFAKPLVESAKNGLVNGLDDYLINQNKIKDLRDVIDDMTSWRGNMKYDIGDRSKFIENNSNKLDRDILGFLFDNYYAQSQMGKVKIKDIYNLDQSDSELEGNILKDYDGYIAGEAANTIFNNLEQTTNTENKK